MERIHEENRVQYQRMMDERDKLNPSPGERAEFLFSILQKLEPKPTIWDMVCFSAEILAVASEDLPTLQPLVMQIISSVYTAHYNVREPFKSSVRSHDLDASNEQDAGSGASSLLDSRPPLTLIRSGDESTAESGDDSGNVDNAVGENEE